DGCLLKGPRPTPEFNRVRRIANLSYCEPQQLEQRQVGSDVICPVSFRVFHLWLLLFFVSGTLPYSEFKSMTFPTRLQDVLTDGRAIIRSGIKIV
ncbi:hypothetical protein, partial [Mesorhizobium sp. M1C.F.Ca.ET.187.01.1.1]|uniref:hypothetical protein n=1 Tax=Mesorhizobium sp. M1C.F.Ca.ET.187.01.1.1 TaxID=2563923 RepID=UPI001AEE17F2